MTTMLYRNSEAFWVPSPALGTTCALSWKRVTGCGCTYVNDLVPDEEIHCNGFQIIFDGKQYTPPEYVEVSKIETQLGPVEIWTSVKQRQNYQGCSWNDNDDKQINLTHINKNTPEKAFYFRAFMDYYDYFSKKCKLTNLKPGNIYFANPSWIHNTYFEEALKTQKNIKLIWKSKLAINTHGVHREEKDPRLQLFMFEINA